MPRKTYNSSPMSDDERWSKVLSREEVLGDCNACGRKKAYALRTIYADHSEVIRCLSCNKEGQFEVHDEDYYDNATRWKPLGNDEEENYKDNFNPYWEQGNKRGKRKK